jgi:hypothetical protein
VTLPDHLIPDFEPVAREEAVVTGPNSRFTVLTPRLLRLEHHPGGAFEDRPTQLVWYRDQPVPEFDVERTDTTLRVRTDQLELVYEHGGGDSTGFAPETLSIELSDGTVWRYGDDDSGNLGGALRTLDDVDGPAELKQGLLSRDGWTVVDDSDSLAFGSDGWLEPRTDGEDRYFFGYGDDYRDCLDAFTDIAGAAPMPPRWALGNWWSRYWEYSQDELIDLMTAFRERGLPLSVCVVDMDWHVVENPHHDGWTGWTWNEEYFPDPEGFVEWLHDNGLRTSLNLHPAEGVHPHEDHYEAFASDMGIKPDSDEPVEFDAADPEFMRGYFKHLIDPTEDGEGIDFWWIDWQQWEESPGLPGLDPLWALNHLHALDRTRDGRRPFVLSRWPGLGGHRYPVGFSGDAVVRWDSLRFQPHMTATGANVDFGWWSHDIGGHMGGTGDPEAFGELYARWTQFGVLSPINRIHTTKSASVDKRPWQYGGDVADALTSALRLRHSLVPYIYTMAWRDHTASVPLVWPMYYRHPDSESAHAACHQYYFGSELLAAPHLGERDADTHLSRRSVWLPEGEWFDFFDGEYYDGGWHARYGGLDDLPVYAPAGAIVPLGPEVKWGGFENPDRLRVVVFPGADNGFALYEDDGTSLAHREGAYATTRFVQRFDGDRLEFEIEPAQGDLSHVPDHRECDLRFRGVARPASVAVDGEDHEWRYDAESVTLAVEVSGVDATEGATVTVETDEASLVSRRDRTDAHIEDLLWHFEAPVAATDELREADWTADDLGWLGEYLPLLSTSQRRALLETVTGVGADLIDHDGDERFVVWNPDGRENVTYRYSDWDDGPAVPHHQSGTARRGSVPESAVFDVAGAAELALQYGDFVTVTTATE